MGQRRHKIAVVESTVADALADAYSELESLAEEMRSWHDNMPENLQYGDKGSAVEEAATALEEASSDPKDLPEWWDENETRTALRITLHEATKKRKSRADRCGDAVGRLSAVIDILEQQADVLRANEAHERAEELDTLKDEIEQHKDAAEGVEFPGMFG